MLLHVIMMIVLLCVIMLLHEFLFSDFDTFCNTVTSSNRIISNHSHLIMLISVNVFFQVQSDVL